MYAGNMNIRIISINGCELIYFNITLFVATRQKVGNITR